MVTKIKNLNWLYDFIAMETPTVENDFPKANIFVTTFLISIRTTFIHFFFVAMVTKLNNFSWFYDLAVIETTVVLNNLFVAMVTKFNKLS